MLQATGTIKSSDTRNNHYYHQCYKQQALLQAVLQATSTIEKHCYKQQALLQAVLQATGTVTSSVTGNRHYYKHIK